MAGVLYDSTVGIVNAMSGKRQAASEALQRAEAAIPPPSRQRKRSSIAC